MKPKLFRSNPIVPALSILIAVALCWPSLASAQSETKKDKAGSAAKAGSSAKADSSTKAQAFSPGIKVGAKVPAISLKNQEGEEVSLQSMLQTGPVALVLFRSADW